MSFQLSVSREMSEGRCVEGLFALEGGGGGGIVVVVLVVVCGFAVSRPAVRKAARASLKYAVFGVWEVGSSRVSRMRSSEFCTVSFVAVSSVVVVVVGGAVI